MFELRLYQFFETQDKIEYVMITSDTIGSYRELGNNEMVAELGIKTIKDIEKERNYTKMLQKSTVFLLSYLNIYSNDAKALINLKRLDEGNHYIGECIKVHFLALSYNPQPELVEKQQPPNLTNYDVSNLMFPEFCEGWI